MDRILNFVALRPSLDVPAPQSLADSSDFQQELARAANGADPLNDTAAVAKSFVDDGQFVATADEVILGVELLVLYQRLTELRLRSFSDVETEVLRAVGDFRPPDWAEDASRARNSVLAAYLLEGSAPSGATALKLVHAYGVSEAVLAGQASLDQVNAILNAPLLLPDYLLGLREKTTAPVAPPESADDVATKLMEQFTAARKRHSQLSETLVDILNHDEDELVLSELGEQRPLASLYRTAPSEVRERRGDREDERPPRVLELGEVSSSPLRRAALRSNVVLSDIGVRLLSRSARETLRDLGLDPAVSTVREMQTRVTSERDWATQTLTDLSIELGGVVSLVDPVKKGLIEEVLGPMKVDPVDDPTLPEPVATAAPGSFSKIKPLGIADLFLVRTHIKRYERGEVASLENILGGEKLTHIAKQLSEVETTDTADREQTSLQSLTQTAAEQNSGKTIAQAIGAGRGPLTSDGPETFSRSVTDEVASSSSNRTRKVSVLRQLQRIEESFEHVFDNSSETDVQFGVYQWLDKVYQAQVFNYGTARLLYDMIVPEPAVLFREALSRPRGQPGLPPRPAKFTVPAKKINLQNWSYYAAGHQAVGVEPPPQSQVIVTEPFGGKAPDAYSNELSTNTFEIGECRTVRIPKGYKATMYRLVAETIGWTPFFLRAIIGSKHVSLEGKWGPHVFKGQLDGEVESLPVGLAATGNGVDAGLSSMAMGVEIICEPTDEAISAWQTKTHGLILAANQRRFADYEERVANRDATARLQLQNLSPGRKASIILTELKRTTLAVLTNQNFSAFNATRLDNFDFPYPDAAATIALSAYIRFFEQAVEWEHLEYAFFPYFWGSRSSWVSKLLNSETNPQFAAFLGSGAARVVLPIRPGYEAAFERFLNTGKTPTTDELLDVGGPLWVSLVSQLRFQGADEDSEVPVGEPWEFRLASDLIRARRDGLLPKWTLNAGSWDEEPDSDS
ncbi:MAG TPA: hypothetical protein VFY51_03055 [Pyrinomonadaceae bacterium]|nr:hypothetical protein [Pyrinomonadaceae bacterium]